MGNQVVPSFLDDEVHYAKWPWGLSFSMIATPAAEVVWANRRLPFEGGEDKLLDEFAWHVPLDKSHLTSDARTKTFYAECYGGYGIHHNGGGARCGWTGNWLVKGIGINLLAGYSDEDAAQFRNNGRASLSEILVEAIWGEVLDDALPYGAVRMTAVIRTGESLEGCTHPTGATGIREFVWRPASFMRAPWFHKRPENRVLIPSDTARVKEAIARLPRILPMPAAHSEEELAGMRPLERLKIGLGEMVRRFAEQMAAAKAKRLSHGTLTPSNVCLDGRWNDLNSISALPSYGYRRNMVPFWEDQLSLNRSIELLCFYIGKYFPAASGEPADAMPKTAWLMSLYHRLYEDALARRFVGLCGYPQSVSDRIWAHPYGQATIRLLAERLIYLARSGHSPRRPYHDAMHENTVAGDYDLPNILRRLAAGRLDNVEANLDDLIGEPDVRTVLMQRYRVVADLMFKEAHAQGISTPAFARLVALNANKAGCNVQFLYRNVIFQKCEQLVEECRDIGELRRAAERMIEPVIDEARVVYQEPRDFTTLLWCGDNKSFAYDARTDQLVADIAGDIHRFPGGSGMPVDAGEDVAGVVAATSRFWDHDDREIMK
jgi:hypothetical protein